MKFWELGQIKPSLRALAQLGIKVAPTHFHLLLHKTMKRSCDFRACPLTLARPDEELDDDRQSMPHELIARAVICGALYSSGLSQRRFLFLDILDAVMPSIQTTRTRKH